MKIRFPKSVTLTLESPMGEEFKLKFVAGQVVEVQEVSETSRDPRWPLGYHTIIFHDAEGHAKAEGVYGDVFETVKS